MSLTTRASTSKVFGIGLPKSGTTSLAHALRRLGYRTAHYSQHLQARRGVGTWFRGDFSADCLTEFDAALDSPIAPFFAQLDRRYPGSKFILTVRDIGPWLRSAQRHFKRLRTAEAADADYRHWLRLTTFGVVQYSECRFEWVYEAHHRNVLHHFRDRSGDLLVLNVCAGEGWETLCAFLDKPIPGDPFPWLNRHNRQK